MIKMVHSLRDKGIAILRFDFTGIGESQGDFTNTNLSSNVQDILAAAEFLHENYTAPEILIGHSLGGSAILQAANHLPSAKAVVTIAAPHDPSHLGMLFEIPSSSRVSNPSTRHSISQALTPPAAMPSNPYISAW